MDIKRSGRRRPDPEGQMDRNSSKLKSVIILMAAAAMCFFGASRGEAGAVFLKAIKICLECIGLG